MLETEILKATASNQLDSNPHLIGEDEAKFETAPPENLTFAQQSHVVLRQGERISDELIDYHRIMWPLAETEAIELQKEGGRNYHLRLRAENGWQSFQSFRQANYPLPAAISVVFDVYGDGRGFSLARDLRDIFGFQGHLRAEGPMLPDQQIYLAECGFDTLEVTTAHYARHGIVHWGRLWKKPQVAYQRFGRSSPRQTLWQLRHQSEHADSQAEARIETWPQLAENLDNELRPMTVAERIEHVKARLAPYTSENWVFTTSLGMEDQVLTHYVCDVSDIMQTKGVRLVTLDTGRLFPETYELWQDTEFRYRCKIEAYYPDQAALKALVDQQGINGFYLSIEARQRCCHIRKVEPLGLALKGTKLWMTGLRAEQSHTRADLRIMSYDYHHQLLKFNPLLDQTHSWLTQQIAQSNIPVNKLHQQGFASIGCQPCTRALAEGEEPRAGRWWWEQDQKRECGLHVNPQPTAI